MAFIYKKMLKITIKKFVGEPIIRDGKVIVINEKLDDCFEETFDTSGVEDPPSFRQECIDRAVARVVRFNVEEEESAKRDKKIPKKKIRKLIISSIN